MQGRWCRPRRPGLGIGLLLASAALLGGCASFTTTVETRAPLDQNALAQIKLGETTGAEVAGLLGPAAQYYPRERPLPRERRLLVLLHEFDGRGRPEFSPTPRSDN